MILRLTLKVIHHKRDLNKNLKSQFQNGYNIKTTWMSQYDFLNKIFDENDYDDCYPNVRNHFYRKIATKQERSLFELHEIEYAKEYNLKLRRSRSKKNLPDSYDDIRCGTFEGKNSWKHNSKRKKQYYK